MMTRSGAFFERKPRALNAVSALSTVNPSSCSAWSTTSSELLSSSTTRITPLAMRSISGGTQSRLTSMARERELHEAIDEFGDREPRRFPELGIEAACREPGDRVDLAEVRFARSAIDEKIGARHAEAL